MNELTYEDKRALLYALEEIAEQYGLRDFIKKDGTVALTANWTTPYKITAEQLGTSIAIGTSPLTVVSTTVVTNLNADSVDGVHAATFATDSAVLKKDGSVALTGDWDIGNGRMVQSDKIRARDADGLALYEDGGAGIFIKDGGSVGIGTTGPLAKMDVGGLFTPVSMNAPKLAISGNENEAIGIELRNTNAVDTTCDARISVSDTTGHYLSFFMPGTANAASLFGLTRSGITGLFSNAGTLRTLTIGTVGASDFLLGTTNVSRIFIKAAGSVGIGSTSPAAKLSINGGVHVGGDTDPGDNNLLVDGTLQVDGNTTLGNASTDTITCTGRFIPRTVASDPQHATPGSRPAGSVSEIAYYSGKLYFCTNAATPTWEKITST